MSKKREEVEFFTRILLGIKGNGDVEFGGFIPTKAFIDIYEDEDGAYVVTVDMSEYSDEEFVINGCSDLIDAWCNLSSMMEVLPYMDENVQYLDFPLEMEKVDKGERWCYSNITEATLDNNKLELRYLCFTKERIQ